MTARRAGARFQLDTQSDPYRGWYRLVRNVGPSTWECVDEPYTPEQQAEIRADAAAGPYWPTPADAERIIAERQADADAGRPHVVKFVSHEQWSRYF